MKILECGGTVFTYYTSRKVNSALCTILKFGQTCKFEMSELEGPNLRPDRYMKKKLHPPSFLRFYESRDNEKTSSGRKMKSTEPQMNSNTLHITQCHYLFNKSYGALCGKLMKSYCFHWDSEGK